MTRFRDLSELSDAALIELYAPPRRPWLRVMFVVTADGATQGADGISRGLGTSADRRIFATLRGRADVIVVGAGTVRAEGYEPNPTPMVVVSRSGRVPESLQAGNLATVHLATGSHAPHLAEATELLGDRVLTLGDDAPDLLRLRDALVERGFTDILCEGGPALAGDFWAQDLVDELSVTVVPRIVAGEHLRMAAGPQADVPLCLAGVIADDDGTLLLRYLRA